MSWPLPGALLLGRFYSERNREYSLDRPCTSLGRARDNTIVIRDERIAEHHARIRREGEGYVVEAANGGSTSVNGRALSRDGRRRLSDGDVLRLSDLEFEFRMQTPDPAVPRLWVVGGVHRGKVFRVAGERIVVGRAPESDVQFPDRSVSRRHCAIARDETGWRLEDLGSTNGTVVNGQPIARAGAEAVTLHEGDEIVLGYSRFVFHAGAGAPSPERAAHEAASR